MSDATETLIGELDTLIGELETLIGELDMRYVLAWLKQSKAPANIIGLQERAIDTILAALREAEKRNRKLREALERIAARRERWDVADDEHPFDIVTEFWEAVSTADAALSVSPAASVTEGQE